MRGGKEFIMKKIVTFLLALLLCVCGGAAFTACGQKELIGFDIELARAVADKLGVELECRLISWDSKETELETRLIDVIWNGFTYSEERAENIDFTGFYMQNKQVAIVQKKDASKYTDIESIKTASVFTAEATSAGETVIEDVLGKTNKTADSQLMVFTEVSTGASDVGIVDSTMAGYYITSETGGYHDSLAVVDLGDAVQAEYYAIGCRSGSNFDEVLNHVLAGLYKDGVVEEIAEKYGLQNVIHNGFGDYDEAYTFPTDGDYKQIMDSGKIVLGYTVFAPMAYSKV